MSMRSLLQKKYKGFTLIEAVVSMFVFLIVMIASSQIFTNAFVGYRDAKAVQRDVENAQFALNILAKELRTSSIAGAISTGIRFYDYSQGICFRYEFNNGEFRVAKVVTADRLECRQYPFAAQGVYTVIVSNVIGASFDVDFSSDGSKYSDDDNGTHLDASGVKKVGKATISLQIKEGAGNRPATNIQTTVSLRDYGFVGLQ